MKINIEKIPWLPLSALIFYTSAFILWKINFIPSPAQIFVFLEGLYNSYGLVGLFIASFLEGLVYLGLYFPGSFIIALAVFLSGGKVISLVSISLVFALALTLTSIINYLLGRYILSRRSQRSPLDKTSKSRKFLFSFLHPNALAFYFFDEGINKKNPLKILLVPFIMFPYGLFWAFVLFLLRAPLRSAIESPYIMITAILIWTVIAIILRSCKTIKYSTE